MRRFCLVLAALFVTSACYHAVIETGRPAGSMVVTNNWAHGFIAGLIPPAEVNTAQQCPGGVSKVETQHSFPNMLVQFLTWSIYSPMTISVTCAQGEEENPAPAVRAEVSKAEQAINNAAMLSSIDGKPVYIQLR
jgi:hypothetical protein